MTKYGRSYCPPVFHIEDANNKQIKDMETVFGTLQNSGIDFCVVQRDEEHEDTLIIDSYGQFSLNEKGEILSEVVEMYMDKKSISHITME